MSIFGGIKILHHEMRLITFILSAIIFLYFFVITEETLLIRLLSAGLWVFVGNILYEVPWIFGYYLHKGGIVLALDVLCFALGQVLIIWVFDYLSVKGIKLPVINLKRWVVVCLAVYVCVVLLIKDGFYIQWIAHLDGARLIDPHTIYPFNLVWSTGKTISMLGLIWITGEKKK